MTSQRDADRSDLEIFEWVLKESPSPGRPGVQQRRRQSQNSGFTIIGHQKMHHGIIALQKPWVRSPEFVHEMYGPDRLPNPESIVIGCHVIQAMTLQTTNCHKCI